MSTITIVAMMALAWWWWQDRPSISRRTRDVAGAALAQRTSLELGLCDYSPAPADLSDFETDRTRLEDASSSVAHVSASFTYERLLGFFGRGRDRHTYTWVAITNHRRETGELMSNPEVIRNERPVSAFVPRQARS